MKKTILFLISLFLFISPCWATTYYVDNSGCGDCADYRVVERDCGSGTETNYDTIAEAVAVVGATDIIYVRTGSYGVIDITSKTSGTSGNEITITPYSSETITLIANAAWASAIKIKYTDYWIIDGFQVDDGASLATGQVINIKAAQHNLIKNITVLSPEGDNWFHVVKLEGDSGIPEASSYNVVEDIDASAITSLNGEGAYIGAQVGDWIGGVGAPCNNNEFRRIKLSSLASDAIDIKPDALNNLVEYCHFSGFAFRGIIAADETVIRYNWIDGSSMTNAEFGGIEVCDTNEVYANIVFGITTASAPGIRVCDVYESSVGGNKIYNNTVYNCTVGLGFEDGNGGEAKNNIVYDCSTYELEVSAAATAITLDYNCYNDAAGDLISWDGTGYDASEWAAYKAASGEDANSIISDPLLINAAGSDFTLKPNSPCIDAGVDLGSNYADILSKTTSWVNSVDIENQYNDGRWDIGAYRFPKWGGE